MLPLKSLRTKTLIWALIPTGLVLIAAAVITLVEYERVSRDVVEERDTELARVAAARLAEGLNRYSRVLQDIAAEEDLRSLDPSGIRLTFEDAERQLSVFDARVVVYNTEMAVLGSWPFEAQQLGAEIPVPSEFEKARETLRPTFSNIFKDEISGDNVILIGVPIMGAGNEFRGMLAGMFTIRYSPIGATYAKVLELKAGRTGFAYLVDALISIGIGRILRPIKELTRGAQRIANGDFDQPIATKTGDEVQALAEQFNAMASTLKESYADLERRVDVRTQEFRESEERYRALFEDTRDAIFISSPDGKVIDCNQAALELFGFTRDQAIGSDVGDTYVDPADRARFREELARTGSVRDFEVKLRKRDGTEMYCLLTATRRLAGDGSSLGAQGTVRDITERRHAEESQREMAVLEERNRMAREIHDTLAQGFTGIVLQLEAAEQASEGSPGQVPGHLTQAKGLARESLQEARRSVWNLLPQALEERPLDGALQEEVRRFATEGVEQASFSSSGARYGLASEIQTALLRICQESLTNIKRHAHATEVRVELSFLPEEVCLSVHDNGTGFDFPTTRSADGQSGFGLTGMEQRTRLLGGTLTITSQKGNGTHVEARIPAG